MIRDKKVSIVAPIYKYEPVLAASLIAQTHRNWQLILMHDGEPEDALKDRIRQYDDARIQLYCSPNRFNDWGHSLRKMGLKLADGDFIVNTNADNYYVPIFLERMLTDMCFECSCGENCNHDLVATYCDCLHNYSNYQLLSTSLQYSAIDCGCLMWKAVVAKELGWDCQERNSDWSIIQKAINRYGFDKFQKVNQPLFVHC